MDNISSNQKTLYIIALIFLVAILWLSRWDIKAGPGGMTNSSAIVHFKLDRWTGNTYFCHTTCELVK